MYSSWINIRRCSRTPVFLRLWVQIKGRSAVTPTLAIHPQRRGGSYCIGRRQLREKSIFLSRRVPGSCPITLATFVRVWICNRAPCFDKAICVVPMPSGPNPKRARPRPHAFDPVDKAIEAEFRDWVLKYANN